MSFPKNKTTKLCTKVELVWKTSSVIGSYQSFSILLLMSDKLKPDLSASAFLWLTQIGYEWWLYSQLLRLRNSYSCGFFSALQYMNEAAQLHLLLFAKLFCCSQSHCLHVLCINWVFCPLWNWRRLWNVCLLVRYTCLDRTLTIFWDKHNFRVI